MIFLKSHKLQIYYRVYTSLNFILHILFYTVPKVPKDIIFF